MIFKTVDRFGHILL